MKQLRVTSPFLDTTCSNLRREVGDIIFVLNERAARLVKAGLCEYVIDEEEEKKEAVRTEQPAAESETPAEAPAEEEEKPKRITRTSKKK